jgi:uncharacterized protein (DUF1800 family)
MPTQRFARWCLALAGLAYLVLPTPALAQGSDVIFGSSTDDTASFEDPFFIARSDAEAVRFLNQATFGARSADIAPVRNQPIAIWLEQQMNVAPTLSRQWLEEYLATQGGGVNDGDGGENAERIHRWFEVAVNGQDQVRQKMAYALSQMVVISDRDAFLQNEAVMMAEWNDILVRNALGNYRDLIRDATLSPMMGYYLTTLRNRKFELVRVNDASAPGGIRFSAGNNGVQPDENYAREIMQLFSIGLLVRNRDFSLQDDPGQPGFQSYTTYDEETISTLARVFTGLGHNCSQGARTVGSTVTMTRNCGANNTACTGIGCRFSNAAGLFGASPPRDPAQNSRQLVHPDWYEPMICYPRYHDVGQDLSGAFLPTLIGDDGSDGTFVYPPGTPVRVKSVEINGTQTLTVNAAQDGFGIPVNCHLTGNNVPAATQQACVDYCNNSITNAVDRLFNHPNTATMVARNLIQRLVSANPTPGYIDRVAAVFENNGAGVRGDLRAVARAILLDSEARRPTAQQPVNAGKPREPLVKLVALWRALDARSGDTGLFASGALAGQASRRRWGPTGPQDAYFQRPLGAPSVFNFYEPDYKQPGQISSVGLDGQPSATGLFSPEVQIVNEVSSTTTANDLFIRLCSGYGGAGNNCTGAFTLPTDRAFLPVSTVDALPTDPVQLIEFFNIRLMGGTMSGTTNPAGACPSGKGSGMKGALLKAWMCAPSGTQQSISGLTGGTALDQQRRRALYLLHLVAISPEFGVQR